MKNELITYVHLKDGNVYEHKGYVAIDEVLKDLLSGATFVQIGRAVFRAEDVKSVIMAERPKQEEENNEIVEVIE